MTKCLLYAPILFLLLFICAFLPVTSHRGNVSILLAVPKNQAWVCRDLYCFFSNQLIIHCSFIYFLPFIFVGFTLFLFLFLC